MIKKELLSEMQLKAELCEMMVAVDNYLRSNDIRYSVARGTMLGAIRHNGFIPWDDDIDIGILRKDYNKLLLKLQNNRTICNGLYASGFEIGEEDWPFIKIYNERVLVQDDAMKNGRTKLWIDIFPFDGIAPKGFCSKLRHLRLLALKWMNIADIYSIRGKHDLANIAGNISCSLFPNTLKHNRSIEKMLMAYSYDESKLVTDTGWFDGYASWLTKMDFDQPELLEFESARFFAPHDYRGYLTRCYGHDYMDPPPPEKRFTHTVDARWA